MYSFMFFMEYVMLRDTKQLAGHKLFIKDKSFQW